MDSRQPIFVFISGAGKTLEAIIRGCVVAEVKHVYSSVDDAMGLTVARDAGIMRNAAFNNDKISIEQLDYMIDRVGVTPKLIVLAGYMKLLTPEFISYATKLGISIINIHPSLLPKHKGLNTHQRVLDAGDKLHGFTVHHVTDELDSGPIIHQTDFRVVEDDTVESLMVCVKMREQLFYPMIIDGILDDSK